MEIMAIQPVGFCPGVRRAFELCVQALREKERTVYLLGELVHNKEAVAFLEKRGVKMVTDLSEIPMGATVVTRSHGIEQSTMEKLRQKDAHIVDTTCPRVKRVRDLAQELEKRGYYLIFLGNRNHPEICSILSFLSRKAVILQEERDWQDFDFQSLSGQKIAVLAQTTLPQTTLASFLEWKNQKVPLLSIEIFDTLCAETEKRQKNLVKMIAENNLTTVIVVGGKHSSNTRSLILIAKQQGVRTLWIETPQELEKEYFAPSERIGVASGASTPNWIVDEVVSTLKSLAEEKR